MLSFHAGAPSETSTGESNAEAESTINSLTQLSGSEVQHQGSVSNGKVGLKRSKVTCKKQRELRSRYGLTEVSEQNVLLSEERENF